MGPVVERVLEDEEERDLSQHDRDGSEGDLESRHAEVAADRVEEVDEGELAGEVGQENILGASPDLLVRDLLVLLDLPFTEVRNGVDDEPRNAAAKVDDL